MKPTEKKWSIIRHHPELKACLSRSLNISPVVSQVLINRGFENPDQVQLFLSARLRDLHSPFLMKNMDAAVARVVTALNNREKICIYGDYDVDGITATAILVLFLRELQADVYFYIPGRVDEGYGMNIDAIKAIARNGTRLIITVDCGVSDVEAVSFAATLGVDIVITDHHEVPDVPAPAHVILNPKQPGCSFPFKGLAGVGVAFNLLMALRKTLRERGIWDPASVPNLREYLDLVALGTVADVVPMVDENRIFVRNGLQVMSQGKRPGIRALKAISGIANSEVTANLIAFRLAPRLNACGRLSDAETSVQLLLSQDYDQAMTLAKKVDEKNTLRQHIERKILAEAKSMISNETSLPVALVLSSTSWHPGVVGLCASRLTEEFNRPAILFSAAEKTGEGRGSARSIPGFDLYSAIKSCGNLLKTFGGHKDAAGLTIMLDNLALFTEQFQAVVKKDVMTEEFIPVLSIDAEISLGVLSYDVLEEIERLAPFGPLNPEPIFSSRDIRFYSSMTVGNSHLKLKIKEDGMFFDAIGFNMSSRYNLSDEKIRLAFVPQFHFYNGEKTIQLNVKDIKVQHS